MFGSGFPGCALKTMLFHCSRKIGPFCWRYSSPSRQRCRLTDRPPISRVCRVASYGPTRAFDDVHEAVREVAGQAPLFLPGALFRTRSGPGSRPGQARSSRSASASGRSGSKVDASAGSCSR